MKTENCSSNGQCKLYIFGCNVFMFCNLMSTCIKERDPQHCRVYSHSQLITIPE